MNTKKSSPIKYIDYCVIGSGLSGLIAALKLSEFGSVYLITKEHIKESNSTYAQGGVAVAITPNDSPKTHFEDTLKAGCYHGNPETIKLLTEEGPGYIQSLINWGVEFDKKNNTLHTTKEGAHSHPRILHNKDATGKEIIEKIIRKIKDMPQITILENHFVKELIIQNNTCTGCHIITPKNSILTIMAHATIIATGGAGQVYKHTSNPNIATGDGLMLAYHAGAILTDLEFFQFHPTALYSSKLDTHFLISEATRGEGALLENHKSEAFMKNYHPDGNLAPRDIVSRAIFEEITTTHHPVYLNFSTILKVKELFPTIYTYCKKQGYDILKTSIPISPCAHYLMGGIKTNTYGETTIPQLFAIGESAYTGVHGANRLASNSLLECIVFAHRAADFISKQKKTIHETSLPSSMHSINLKNNKINTVTTYKKIQAIMWEHVSIIRDEIGLLTAKETLESLQKQTKNNTQNQKEIELNNMINLSLLIIESALVRTESKGAHYRKDYPDVSKESYLILTQKNKPLTMYNLKQKTYTTS